MGGSFRLFCAHRERTRLGACRRPRRLARGPAIAPRGSFNNEPCPPLGLAYLAGALGAAGLRVHGIDAAGEALDRISELPGSRFQFNGLGVEEIVERVPRDARVIAVSSMFSHEWTHDRRLIRSLKRAFPSAAIIAGGEHTTALAEFILEDCPELDYCGLGEGEETMLEFCRRVVEGRSPEDVPGLAYRREGRVLRSAPRARTREVDRIPWPDWAPFSIDEYLSRAMSFGASHGRNMPIMASRGCPYQCTFYSSPGMWTTRYYIRSPDDVIREIESYKERYGATGVQFYDLTAIIRKEWTVEFCTKLLDRGIALDWSLPSGTRSEVLDEEVVALLARAGCKYLVYAPESGSVSTLKMIKKKISLGRMKDSVRAAVKNGISVRTNLILGFPHETRADIFRTLRQQLEFAWMGVEDCPLYPFQPYPGSELFEGLRARGRIKIGDPYFETLAMLSNGTFGMPDESFCEHVGRRELHFYRVAGFFLFYAMSYLLRPLRIVRTAVNLVFTQKNSSVFEQRLKDKWRRLRWGAAGS